MAQKLGYCLLMTEKIHRYNNLTNCIHLLIEKVNFIGNAGEICCTSLTLTKWIGFYSRVTSSSSANCGTSEAARTDYYYCSAYKLEARPHADCKAKDSNCWKSKLAITEVNRSDRLGRPVRPVWACHPSRIRILCIESYCNPIWKGYVLPGL